MTILQGLLHFSGMNLGNGIASNAWWYMKTIAMSYNIKKVSEFVCNDLSYCIRTNICLHCMNFQAIVIQLKVGGPHKIC